MTPGLFLALVLRAGAVEMLYVAPDGSDEWSGRVELRNAAGSDGPLASPQGARDAIRRLKRSGLPTGAITVQFAEGIYPLGKSLVLEAEDSGSAEAPIIYRAANGAAVRISGGRDFAGFAQVTDPAVLQRLPETARSHVMQADLIAQGITEFGTLSRRGFAKPLVDSHLELFWNDKPMTLARWPNVGEKVPYSRIAALPDGEQGLVISADDGLAARLEKWADEKDPWLFGYWFWDWADEYIPTKIDPGFRVLSLPEPKPAFGLKTDQRFYGLNLLCELDQPGEWYLDRETGRLYFWPPSDLGQAYVSLTSTLFDLNNVTDVALRGFICEGTRGTAIRVKDSSRVKIEACTLRNIGNNAVSITGGSDCSIVDCEIYGCAEGGVIVRGGDRKTLTPCGHYVDGNHIYDYSRWSRTYRAGIAIEGVGVRASHNHIHDAPHNAILLSGNDHLVEFNEIHHVAQDTGDVGAFYMGRDWTARGTIIRYNYFHHIKGPGTHGAMGVYLDDQASGISVIGNVFFEVTRAVFIGGGDDNLVENNLFVNCVPAVHIDARGLNWQKKDTDDPNGELRRYLSAMPYQNELWSRRYPTLVNILEGEPNAAERNCVLHNVSVRGTWRDVDEAAEPQLFESNLTVETLEFAQPLPAFPRATDYKLGSNSPAFAVGFKPIPLEKIGRAWSVTGAMTSLRFGHTTTLFVTFPTGAGRTYRYQTSTTFLSWFEPPQTTMIGDGNPITLPLDVTGLDRFFVRISVGP